MPLLVLLIPADERESFLGAKAVEALSRLGVTTVSVARDEESVAVILDGWAFDGQSRQAAIEAIGAGTSARALHPILQMAVAASWRQRRPAADRSRGRPVVGHEGEVSPS
jgi:hypothetical protein